MYKVYMGPYSVNLVVAEPIHVEHLLSSPRHINRSGLHDNFKPFLGNSLACSKDDTWRQHRKLLLPAFHNEVLEKCMPIFNEATADLIETLQKLTDRDFNCAPVISEHALSAICGSVMGESSKFDVKSNQTYMHALNALTSIAMARVFSIFERSDLLFRLSNNYREQSKHLKTVHKFADDIITKMRKKRQGMNNGVANGGPKERESFLGFMLDLEEKGAFTEQDVRDEMNILLFAGHDTVATSVSFGLYELAKHPEVQEKIYHEALSILGNNHYATIKDIDSMKYLNRCMKETLRLYTIAPFFDRELAQRDILDGTWIPKETIITFFPYAMHRNPEFYPEPEKFDPERWQEELEMRRPKYSFIPFSGGPRNCIGFKFGILEWKLTVAMIILNFHIEPVKGFEVELAMHGVLKSKNGMEIRLRKRV